MLAAANGHAAVVEVLVALSDINIDAVDDVRVLLMLLMLTFIFSGRLLCLLTRGSEWTPQHPQHLAFLSGKV